MKQPGLYRSIPAYSAGLNRFHTACVNISRRAMLMTMMKYWLFKPARFVSIYCIPLIFALTPGKSGGREKMIDLPISHCLARLSVTTVEETGSVLLSPISLLFPHFLSHILLVINVHNFLSAIMTLQFFCWVGSKICP